MSKALNTKQLCSIIFILMISNKLLVLPGMIYDSTRNDSILFIMTILLIDFLIIMLFAFINKKYQNTTFIQMSYKIIGKIFTKILLIFILAYFALKLYITLKETENFLNTTIYIDLSSFIFILPCIITIFYVVSKGLRNVVRVTEIFSFIIFLGLIISLLLAIPNINIDGILPLFTTSIGDWWESLLKSSIWFGNYIILFLLVGQIKVEKNYYKNIFIAFITGFVIIVLLFSFFYSIFGSSSVIHHFAISDITSFTPSLASLTKVDWFTVIFYSFADIIQLILQLYVIIQVLKEVFERKINFATYSIIAILSILFYVYAPFGFDFMVQLGSVKLGLMSLIVNLSAVFYFAFIYFIYWLKNKNLYHNDKGQMKNNLIKSKRKEAKL